MPQNPLGVTVRNKSLQTLVDFCKQRNIPFNQNERRYYLKAKQEISKNTFNTVMGGFLNEILQRHQLKELDKHKHHLEK